MQEQPQQVIVVEATSSQMAPEADEEKGKGGVSNYNFANITL